MYKMYVPDVCIRAILYLSRELYVIYGTYKVPEHLCSIGYRHTNAWYAWQSKEGNVSLKVPKYEVTWQQSNKILQYD